MAVDYNIIWITVIVLQQYVVHKFKSTYISPLMYSSLLATVAFASSRSCFTKTGPINL